jgi:SpoVK/Ycf46/Vps4 family AAA+-type ATPase
LEWHFVEVLASDFLSRGIDAVPALADEVFDSLMQIDRCVVLFDEIDELIRDRTDGRADPFGRFLTTSMLPKLAKLWEQRRVIFFVATNHAQRADPAITRSSRFDARIFVAPPSLEVKQRELKRLTGVSIPQEGVSAIYRLYSGEAEDSDRVARADESYGVLPLLRYDQIPELARRISAAPRTDGANPMPTVLKDMGAALTEHEWKLERQDDVTNGEPDHLERLQSAYRIYVGEETRDFSRRMLAAVKDDAVGAVPDEWESVGENGSWHYYDAVRALALSANESRNLRLPGTPDSTDEHLLRFIVDDTR